jgi:hypothetical protein
MIAPAYVNQALVKFFLQILGEGCFVLGMLGYSSLLVTLVHGILFGCLHHLEAIFCLFCLFFSLDENHIENHIDWCHSNNFIIITVPVVI